jgi:hypothetical protein
MMLFLQPQKQANSTASPPQVQKFTAKFAHVRSLPGMQGKVICKVKEGSDIEAGTIGDWRKTSVCGTSGYIHSSMLKKSKTP